MSAFGGKADVDNSPTKRPLIAISGHPDYSAALGSVTMTVVGAGVAGVLRYLGAYGWTVAPSSLTSDDRTRHRLTPDGLSIFSCGAYPLCLAQRGQQCSVS